MTLILFNQILLQQHCCSVLRFPLEHFLLGWFGTVTCTGHTQGTCALRIVQPEMQCGKAPHRVPDHMRLVNAGMVQYSDHILHGALL